MRKLKGHIASWLVKIAEDLLLKLKDDPDYDMREDEKQLRKYKIKSGKMKRGWK